APYTKDGINDRVVHGRESAVNPTGLGTKAAYWYRFDAVPPGQAVRIRLRLAGHRPGWTTFGPGFEEGLRQRTTEAGVFYAGLRPAGLPDSDRLVARRAFAGLLWSRKAYRYDVRRWLAGDPGQPVPPASRLTGRNHRWPHVAVKDVLSIPDEWEYPWF